MPTLEVHWDERVLDHRVPDGAFSLAHTDLLAVDEPHPDQPERVTNVKHALERTLGDSLRFAPVAPATREQLRRVHTESYLATLRASCERGGERLTPTTATMAATYDAARYAAGAAVGTAESALADDETVPYALVRPSGHHAQSDRADGFCFVNNVAVAAEHVLATGQADRVAIVDWDVHHGNGTQEIFYDRDDVLVVSLHNDHGSWNPDSHPQTGSLDERGSGAGAGYTVNVPLPFGTGDAGYEYAFERLVEPVVEAFDPDLLLVSAGQDPGARDPLGRNVVSVDGFEALGARARALADRSADGHLGVVQEGGYQLTHLAFATLGALAGATGLDPNLDGVDVTLSPDPFGWPNESDDAARDWISAAAAVHGRTWPLDERR